MFDVLLALDSDEARAREQAAAVADLPDAAASVSATLLHVFPEVRGDEGRAVDTAEYAGTPDAVAAAADYLAERDIETETRRATGDPAMEILRVARDLEADRIVVGGRRRSPVGKAVFGSVTQEVILNADRPVVAVGDG